MNVFSIALVSLSLAACQAAECDRFAAALFATD
jgi:hypothetical protein